MYQLWECGLTHHVCSSPAFCISFFSACHYLCPWQQRPPRTEGKLVLFYHSLPFPITTQMCYALCRLCPHFHAFPSFICPPAEIPLRLLELRCKLAGHPPKILTSAFLCLTFDWAAFLACSNFFPRSWFVVVTISDCCTARAQAKQKPWSRRGLLLFRNLFSWIKNLLITRFDVKSHVRDLITRAGRNPVTKLVLTSVLQEQHPIQGWSA